MNDETNNNNFTNDPQEPVNGFDDSSNTIHPEEIADLEQEQEIETASSMEHTEEQSASQPYPTYVWQPDEYQTNGSDYESRPLYSETLVKDEKKKKKGKHTFWRYTAAVIAGMFAGAVIFGGALQYANAGRGITSPITQNPKPTSQATQVGNSTDGALSVVDIAAKAGPSVVGIINRQKVTTFFGTQTNEEGGGSGIIITSDGYIVTNAHVVENATSLSVVLNAGSDEYEATLIGMDAKTDLAVIKIEETNLPTAEIGTSSDLQVGELAVAIGNPGGQEFAGSVTAGVISALNRSMNVEGRQYTLIQTDAAINPGNSGGALLNQYGQVIGISSVKISAEGFEGMGFAIPIDSAMPIINELMTGDGYIKGRPVIGITPREITEQMSQVYGLPIGVYVTSVSEFSAAEKAGIKIGDVIVKADGQQVTTIQELNDIRDTHKAGEEMTLDIVRENRTMTVTVTLDEEKPQTNQ